MPPKLFALLKISLIGEQGSHELKLHFFIIL